MKFADGRHISGPNQNVDIYLDSKSSALQRKVPKVANSTSTVMGIQSGFSGVFGSQPSFL